MCLLLKLLLAYFHIHKSKMNVVIEITISIIFYKMVFQWDLSPLTLVIKCSSLIHPVLIGDGSKKQVKQNKARQLCVRYSVFNLILMEVELSLLFCS